MQYNHIFQNLTSTGKGPIQAYQKQSQWPPNFIFLNDRENYIQANIFLFTTAEYITNGDMILQKSRQGVSKLGSIVELWTNDGISLTNDAI